MAWLFFMIFDFRNTQLFDGIEDFIERELFLMQVSLLI